ncbi:disintegrin and metalloproteinase domain-containing protein 29 [Striga asiatica]|uniref:Disintegrin and metalloproteinase domain-containing protein 29 n=1 Tax=Striga asiatica TaxID=4170 RepID=A0A5A7RE46_STRAF|nr:disintegrin and metalloproteinase domain-containing protein 29 [Striga asiatica]
MAQTLPGLSAPAPGRLTVPVVPIRPPTPPVQGHHAHVVTLHATSQPRDEPQQREGVVAQGHGNPPIVNHQQVSVFEPLPASPSSRRSEPPRAGLNPDDVKFLRQVLLLFRDETLSFPASSSIRDQPAALQL